MTLLVGHILSGLCVASLLFCVGLECGDQIPASPCGMARWGAHSTEAKGVERTPGLWAGPRRGGGLLDPPPAPSPQLLPPFPYALNQRTHFKRKIRPLRQRAWL